MATPALRFCGFLLLACTFLTAEPGRAQAPAAAVPEIEALRGPYQRNLATIRAAADARLEFPINSYLAGLDRLGKQDPTAADAIAGERARFTAKKDLTPEERKLLPPAVAALRAQYDADRQRAEAPFLQQEAQQTRQYMSALETTQHRLLATNQVQKAAAVDAERRAVGGVKAVAATERPEKAAAESTVRTAGKLDPALGTKIAAAVSSKGYERSASSAPDDKEQGGSDIPEEGGVLVGFEFMEHRAKEGMKIRSLRPYFLTKEGVVAGKDRGKMESVTEKVLARADFGVAGLLVDNKSGMQVIFMKIDPATGRFDSGANNTYKSKWFGTKGREKPVQIGGEGNLSIGVYGKTGADCDTIGLVQMK